MWGKGDIWVLVDTTKGTASEIKGQFSLNSEVLVDTVRGIL